MKVFFDPPSGWKYGFPKIIECENLDEIDDNMLIEILRESNYPESDIDLALKYSRFSIENPS